MNLVTTVSTWASGVSGFRCWKKKMISNPSVSIHLFSSLLSTNSQVLKEINVFLRSSAKIPRLITWEGAWEMTYPICLGQVPIARKRHRSGWEWGRLRFPRKKSRYSHLNKGHRTSQVSRCPWWPGSYVVPFPLISLTYLLTHPVHPGAPASSRSPFLLR